MLHICVSCLWKCDFGCVLSTSSTWHGMCCVHGSALFSRNPGIFNRVNKTLGISLETIAVRICRECTIHRLVSNGRFVLSDGAC